MGSAYQDLLRKVEKLEFEALAKFKFTPACLSGLEGLLCDAFVKQEPRPVDYHNREQLVRIFNVMAREVFGTNMSFVEGFGSFIMDMFNEKSDLDLSINFINTEVDRKVKIKMLRRFTKKLQSIQRKGHVSSVLLVASAKVPIIKLTDKSTGIECDLSIDNRDGIAKSHIIHAISGIDARFRMLCFLMKSWAKANNINSARDRSLNSFSIVSLVAFHLQTCNPPILPPFSALLREGADPASVARVVRNYVNYGKRNKETLAELFTTLFIKLASVEKLWQIGACASIYEGSWTLKSWGQRSYSISIEDFTDPSQNAARAVGPEGFMTIYNCIHTSLNHLWKFLNGQMQGTVLMHHLFGAETISTPRVGVASYTNGDNALTLQDSRHPKKRRLEEGLAHNQVKMQHLQGPEPQGMGGMQQAAGQTAVNNLPASFTRPVSLQPPLAMPRTNINGNHGYDPGAGPSRLGGFHNPSQSQFFSLQNFQGFAGTSSQNAVALVGNGAIPVAPVGNIAIGNVAGNVAIRSHPPHQNAVAPIGNGAIHSHPPPASHNPYRGDRTLYNHRRY